MEIRSIKGVDERTWMQFKVLAIKKRQTMGKLFSDMVEKHAKTNDEFWDGILSGKKIISDKEAEEMYLTVKKLRKDRGFRNGPDI